MQDGEDFRLFDALLDSHLLLYFYPKDMTSGCTVQAIGFRDMKDHLAAHGIRIVGVSKDSPSTHLRFIEKYNLNFDLLADVEKKVCDQFGCLVEKSMYGKKYLGIQRSTFLIGKEGLIIKEWRNVNPKDHCDDVLQYIECE